jgi:hypothetical protein
MPSIDRIAIAVAEGIGTSAQRIPATVEVG